MEETKKQFPTMASHSLYMDMRKMAFQFISEFSKEIMPILNLWGLNDEESINKFMRSLSTEDIYKTAKEKDDQRLKLFEDFSKARGEDFWKKIRHPQCDVESPSNEGFVFMPMPLSKVDSWLRTKVLNAISYKEGRFEISDNILKKESVVVPDSRRQELYAMVSEFCANLKEKKFKNRQNMHILFTYDKDGDLAPNAHGIMWGHNGIS